MRKLIAGLLAAFLMTTGIVALTSSPASAGRCPYTGCIRTDISGKAFDTRKPGKVRTIFRVRTAGNAVPRGKVRVIIKGNGRFRARTVRYPAVRKVKFFGVPDGSYQVFFKYIPGRSTIFRRSSQITVVTVK